MRERPITEYGKEMIAADIVRAAGFDPDEFCLIEISVKPDGGVEVTETRFMSDAKLVPDKNKIYQIGRKKLDPV